MAAAEGVVGAVAASTAGAKPPARVKLFYSFGQVVESGYLVVNTFVFFYYTAVLGLSGSLVGLAVAISMALDAAADPLIGSWSDSLRSRFGRRLPLMLLGAPLTMLTMGLLFSPPAGLGVVLLFGWLTLTKMAVRAFASLYNIPYYALGGEMTDDYVERTRLVAYRLLAGIVTTVAIMAVATMVFFAGEGGLQRPERYPPFGWTIGAGVLVVALICCAGVWRHAVALPQPKDAPAGLLKRLPGELAEVFRNRSFLVLFFSLLVFSSSAGAHQALNNHAYVFVWQLRPELIQIPAYVYLFGILLATPLTPFLLRWMEKKTAAAIGFLTVMAAWLGVPSARALGLFAPVGMEAVPWLSLMNIFVGLGSGIVFVALPAMMADAADEHEHLFGHRREALYFSGISFGAKAAAGMGALIGGVTLDLLRFPAEAGRQVNAVISEDILAGLMAGWAVFPALLCLVGSVMLLPYALGRARQSEVATAIRAKRAAEASAARSS